MILSEFDWTRFLIIFIVQSSLFLIYLLISIKILARRRDRISVILSCFYISETVGFLLSFVYLWVRIKLLTDLIYFVAAWFLIFGYIFIVIFILNLYKYDVNLKYKLIIIVSYAISIVIILSIPGGIIISDDANWRPIFSLTFLIYIYILFTCFICVPTMILLTKVYKRLKYKDLRQKFKRFFIGVCGILVFSYGSVLYNTWNNQIFRIVYAIIVLMCVPSGILICYGIGRAY